MSTERTTCVKGKHPWTPENIIIEPKSGMRRCRSCRYERNHIYMKAYRQTPKFKAMAKAYRQTEKSKEIHRKAQVRHRERQRLNLDAQFLDPNTGERLTTVIRSYKVELDLNNKQTTYCLMYAGIARFVYNWALARANEVYAATKKTPHIFALQEELNILKQTEFSWMYKASKQVPQGALKNLGFAFDRFFERLHLRQEGKTPRSTRVGYPKFKKKSKKIGSFEFSQHVHIYDNTVQLPRLGHIRLKEHGYIPTYGKICRTTVSEHAGHWYLTIAVKTLRKPVNPPSGEPIGVDLGIKTLATLSNGVRIYGANALRRYLRKIKRLQHSKDRKKLGGKNRLKANRKLARLHMRVANIRRDTIDKFTAYLTKNHSEVIIEDLNVVGILKNSFLANSLIDASFGAIRSKLTYKAERDGSRLILINRWYPSSKTCSACGWINRNQTLDDRLFICLSCGLQIDRDLNAAKNILAAGSVESLNACGQNTTTSGLVLDACMLSEAGTEHQYVG